MRFAAFKNFVCDQAPIQLLDSTVGLCLKLKKQNNNTFRCALTFSFQTQILSSKIILFLLYFLLPYNLFEKFVIVTLGSYNKDNWNDVAFMHSLNPGDPMAVRNYTQQYRYDGVGNILQMQHRASGNDWTRNYSYQTANNRLISTQIGAETYTYQHHVQHGFMTAMPHLEEMGWNFKEELAKTIKQKVNPANGTAETTTPLITTLS